MKKWIGIVVALAALVAIYMYINQPHRSIQNAEGISIEADSLFLAFAQNEATANALYLNKVLVVHGTIKSIDHNAEGKSVVVLEAGDLMFGINCTLDGEFTLKEGDEVTVKGICTGYLADVVITQAVIEKNP